MGTVRQAVLANAIAEGMPISEAGILAGYKSRQNADDAYRSIRNKMIADLGEIGVGTRALALKIKEKLDAKETKLFQKDGIITDAIDLEAHSVQLHAVELCADILGLRDTGERGTSIGTINILWHGESPTWAGQSSNALVTDSIPNGIVTEQLDTPPISTVEGTGPGPGPSPHIRSAKTAGEGVLTQRVVKKRKPRLPILGKRGPK